jgi:hypothetical protein
MYFDVAGVLGVSGGRDGLLNPALLVNSLQINILRSTKGLLGPVFFFINDDLFFEDYFSAVAKQLPHQDSRGWDITCWPNERPPVERAITRDLVFISHANPQDNDVTVWLASRLAASGYQVWSDVTRLIGGEYFWDTIEDAIRNRAAKVVVILSRAGHQKPGVLDEVNIAVGTERAERLERFVIPVRVDDLPFGEVRANLARKNIIDGCSDLAGALSRLLKILEEDQVPKRQKAAKEGLRILQELGHVQYDQTEWACLVENRIEVLEWPRAIRKFRSRANQTRFEFPTHSVAGGAITFEEWEEISKASGNQIQRAGEAAFDPTGLSESTSLIFATRLDARRATASLLRQAWDRACASQGFRSFALATNNVCWYLPFGFQPTNRVRFVDAGGINRQKALVGRSPRKKVYWHFAIEAKPNVSDGSFRLVPHVIFSEDGHTALSSTERQHSLRRSFCRNWWNARWRDLLQATLKHMSAGADVVHLPVGIHQKIQVSANLDVHKCEFSSSDASNQQVQPRIFRLDEPRVSVGFDQTSDYPKKGLLLFGPVSFERNPKVIRTGLIGTKEGIDLFSSWSRQFNGFQADAAQGRNALPFPGFEAVFGAKWAIHPIRTIALSRTDLINTIRLQDRHQAIFGTVGMYVDKIRTAVHEDDLNVDIWFVVIPDEVFVYGRPDSRVPSAIAIATPGAMGRRLANRFLHSMPSLFPEDNEEAKIYDHHLDFHHQLKARLLDVRAVTQVLRESSLATITRAISSEAPDIVAEEDYEDDFDEENGSTGATADAKIPQAIDPSEALFDEGSEFDASAPAQSVNRKMQDRASVAWNLATAIFFKAGGRPWRVASARAGVCYIGLIFKRDPNSRSQQACCGAQMFLQDSDGLVFKGAIGPWYSPETKQFHLSRTEAKKLIETVLRAYSDEHVDPPGEIFIHGRTRFSDAEWAGFCDAVDLTRTQLVGVRITRSNEYKLYSSGERAVRRGTVLRVGGRLALLWTSGFIENLGTYPGRETPNPLRVEIVRDSKSDIALETVLRDILMLTKMNFNSCVYADGIPVTMRFADAIGDVLMTAKDTQVPPLPFRYYI